MQNIPGIALDTAEQAQKKKFAPTYSAGSQNNLFDELFSQHSELVENELALSPVSTSDKMVETAPATAELDAKSAQPVHKAEEKAESTVGKPSESTTEEGEDTLPAKDQRMTEEEFDELKDDLEEYGLSEQEIAELEEKVKSEDGMTWGEFVSTLSHKMAAMRKVSLSDEQKGELGQFFSKFGFTPKESAKLIEQVEKGEVGKVMNALQTKLDKMPQNQPLLIDKNEIESFASAMNFSKEFTSKLKEVFAQQTLPKDVKEAFTLMRQEMKDMDEKDRELVQAVGKVVAKVVGKQNKETTVANQVKEAVDLKDRVAEHDANAENKENLRQAVQDRKDSMADANARRNRQTAMPEKAVVETGAEKGEADINQQKTDSESDQNWKNFFGKLQEDTSSTRRPPVEIKAEADQSLKTSLLDGQSKSSKAPVWEKVSAPKVMRQVETAFMKTMSTGAKQLTLQLTPENLGKLNIVLQVHNREVNATIKAESPEAARIIADNLDVIKASLENQGLKVEKLDVQTGLAGQYDDKNWSGQDQHNLARDREAMAAMRNHMRAMRGDGGGVAQDMQNVREQAITADQGLHVIA